MYLETQEPMPVCLICGRDFDACDCYSDDDDDYG